MGMKTILKVYDHGITAIRGMLEDIRVSTLTGLEYKVKHTDGTLELEGDVKIIYKTLEDPAMSFHGLTVDEIYFDDLVNKYDRFGIGGIVKIRKNEETSKESEEFYYVVEYKVGDVSRVVRTNDKGFVETLFRENR